LANETEHATFNAFRAGWTIGSGAEWAFNPQWSLKGEYRYSQFSAVTGTGSVTLANTNGSTAYVAHSTGDIRENSFRLGVDYHFN
jgi:outer membrane immunogenic protein